MRKPGERRVGRPRASAKGLNEDTREAILVGAAQLFSEKSFEGTQLNQIAERVGIRTPSIYHYFAGKDEIRRAISGYTVAESSAFAKAVLEEKGAAKDRLFRILSSHIRHLTAGPYDLRFLIALNPAPLDPDTEGNFAAWRQSVIALFHAGVAEKSLAPIDPTLMIYMVIGAIQGAIQLRHVNESVPAETIASLILKAFSVDCAEGASGCNR